jgi:hypothetical protein
MTCRDSYSTRPSKFCKLKEATRGHLTKLYTDIANVSDMTTCHVGRMFARAVEFQSLPRPLPKLLDAGRQHGICPPSGYPYISLPIVVKILSSTARHIRLLVNTVAARAARQIISLCNSPRSVRPPPSLCQSGSSIPSTTSPGLV